MTAPYFMYEAADFLSGFLGRDGAFRVSDAFSDAALALMKKRREAVRANLAAIGASSDDAAVRRVFRNFGRYFADFLRYTRLAGSPPRVRLENFEVIESALARGGGVIVLSAHLGNWELGAATLAEKRPVSVVVYGHPDPDTNAFFNARRERRGVRPIPVGTALRRCLSVLQANEIVGVLGDRRYSSDGVEVEFFGRKTLLPRGPAFLSIRSGAPIIGASMLPDGTGYRMCFTEEIRPEEHTESSYYRETAKMLERLVRVAPEQWLIFDRMWSEAKEGNVTHDSAR